MATPIDFYFDFGSPYGYAGSSQINAIAAKHGRQVRWRPFLIGIAMQKTGSTPLVQRPLIDAYSAHDFPRTARLYNLPFTMPAVFPVSPVAASRAFYALDARDPDAAITLAQAIYAAYWGKGVDITSVATVTAIAATLGHDATALAAQMADQAVKDRLRNETSDALDRGVFGSPFVIVDNEPFWGTDRLWQVDRWLETGGW